MELLIDVTEQKRLNDAITMESPAPSRNIFMTIVAILALAQAHWALWASLCGQEHL